MQEELRVGKAIPRDSICIISGNNAAIESFELTIVTDGEACNPDAKARMKIDVVFYHKSNGRIVDVKSSFVCDSIDGLQESLHRSWPHLKFANLQEFIGAINDALHI